MYTFCVVVIILSLCVIVINLLRIGQEDKQSARDFLDTSDRITSAYYSDSIKTVKNSIERLEVSYELAKDTLGDIGETIYKEDKTALLEHLHDLEQAKWEKKALKYLQEFLDCYNMIVHGEFDNFKDVELLFQTKSKCMDIWQKYFAIDLSEYETTIFPKRYMREWLGEDYDPCMETHDALEKKLSGCVATMRPEYKRKMKLFGLIIQRVSECGTVPRSELLKWEFNGYIPEEVRCCYKALIKDNRLVEIKLADRYFVSLPDSEISIGQNMNDKGENRMIARSDKLVHDAIVKHLMDEGEEYIDMTHKGGGLYFFSESIAEELKSKGYNIGYAEKGSRSTSGRPAWYLKQ